MNIFSTSLHKKTYLLEYCGVTLNTVTVNTVNTRPLKAIGRKNSSLHTSRYIEMQPTKGSCTCIEDDKQVHLLGYEIIEDWTENYKSLIKMTNVTAQNSDSYYDK